MQLAKWLVGAARLGVVVISYATFLGCAASKPAGGAPAPWDAAHDTPSDSGADGPSPSSLDAVAPAADAGATLDSTGDADDDLTAPLDAAVACFTSGGSSQLSPDYDQFVPNYGSHCEGTNHQAIAGVQKVVYLGDSITTGTPPTAASDFYRNRLTKLLEKRFGKLEVKNCSVFGARVDDLLQKQIKSCFPDPVEPKTTLVIMTIGGNDMHAFAKDAAKGTPLKQIMNEVDQVVTDFRDAIAWFRKDPKRFPRASTSSSPTSTNTPTAPESC